MGTGPADFKGKKQDLYAMRTAQWIKVLRAMVISLAGIGVGTLHMRRAATVFQLLTYKKQLIF